MSNIIMLQEHAVARFCTYCRGWPGPATRAAAPSEVSLEELRAIPAERLDHHHALGPLEPRAGAPEVASTGGPAVRALPGRRLRADRRPHGRWVAYADPARRAGTVPLPTLASYDVPEAVVPDGKC